MNTVEPFISASTDSFCSFALSGSCRPKLQHPVPYILPAQMRVHTADRASLVTRLFGSSYASMPSETASCWAWAVEGPGIDSFRGIRVTEMSSDDVLGGLVWDARLVAVAVWV